jgi:hypothetical protein
VKLHHSQRRRVRGQLLPLRRRRQRPPEPTIPSGAAPLALDTPLPPIRFSQHAVQRFRERVRDQGSDRLARRELARLAEGGHVTAEPPSWLTSEEEAPDAWLILGPDVCCPLVRRTDGRTGPQVLLLASSVITRGSLGPVARESRNAGRVRRKEWVAAGRARGRAPRPHHDPDAHWSAADEL